MRTFKEFVVESRLILRSGGVPQVDESLFDGMTQWGKYIEVFKNPTGKDYMAIGGSTFRGSILTVRAIIYGEDVYAWNQNRAEHSHVMAWLASEHKMSRPKMVTVYIDYTASAHTVQVRVSTWSMDNKAYTQAHVNTLVKTLPAFNGLKIVEPEQYDHKE